MRFVLVESILLTEDIESMKKYYPNIPEEKFMDYIKLDPTYNGGNNAGTYARWILNLANKNAIDNIGHMKDLLTRFDDSKKTLKDKDIMKFKSMDDLEAYLNDENSYTNLSHRQEVRQRQQGRKNADISKDAKLVYEDSDWQVFIPLTYEASCKLGQGARWCTASTESDYYYNYYKNNYGGDYYILINKKNPEEKFQFHFESGQFMDDSDSGVDLGWFLSKNEGLDNFFFNEKGKALIEEILPSAEKNGKSSILVEKSKIAKAVSEQDSRDGLSQEFVLDCLQGNALESFEGYQESWRYATEPYDDVSDYIRDGMKERVKNLYIENNGTDDAEEYEDLDIDEQIKYFIEHDDDIERAFALAYDYASAVGASDEAEKDVISGIMRNMPEWVIEEDTELVNNSDNYSMIGINYNDIRKYWAYLVDTSSDEYGTDFLENIILQSIRDKIGRGIYEPRYGWYGFSKDAFIDELDFRLSEIGG